MTAIFSFCRTECVEPSNSEFSVATHMSSSVLSDSIPLQERLRLKKVGSEIYNDYTTQSSTENGSFQRSNKNQPIEMTSKKPVGRFRQVVDVRNKRPHDPRFDPLCGKLNQDLFAKSYSFLDSYKVTACLMMFPLFTIP